MSNNWWANKLAPAQPQQPRGGVVLPPVQPHYQQPPHHGQPGQYQQTAPVPAQQVQVGPDGKIHIMDAIVAWKGGIAHRSEGGLSCPACGSQTGYTHYSGTAGNRPAPHCFVCGYNGRFSQGDQASWS